MNRRIITIKSVMVPMDRENRYIETLICCFQCLKPYLIYGKQNDRNHCIISVPIVVGGVGVVSDLRRRRRVIRFNTSQFSSAITVYIVH